MTDHQDPKSAAAWPWPWPHPLEKPADWNDPKEQWKAIDCSKVRRYVASEGFEYWLDIVNNRVSTSLPDVYLQFHSYYGHTYSGHSYGTLHFDGSFVVISKTWKTRLHASIEPRYLVAFSPDFSERTTDGAQIWHIDEILRVLELPDNEHYPWVDMWVLLPRVEVRGMSHFKSREQQERFIYLCETLLSCHNGASFSARQGDVTRGKVIWGQEVMRKFASGEFIAGA